MGHQSYVLLCTKTTLSNPPVVIPKSSCDVHLFRSPWIRLQAMHGNISACIRNLNPDSGDIQILKRIKGCSQSPLRPGTFFKLGPKHGVQKAGCKKKGSLLFKKRRGSLASPFLNNNGPVFNTLLFAPYILDPMIFQGCKPTHWAGLAVLFSRQLLNSSQDFNFSLIF